MFFVYGALTDSKDLNAYWRWSKHKLLRERGQTVSAAHAFKFFAPDGKRRSMDARELGVTEGTSRCRNILLSFYDHRSFKKY